MSREISFRLKKLLDLAKPQENFLSSTYRRSFASTASTFRYNIVDERNVTALCLKRIVRNESDVESLNFGTVYSTEVNFALVNYTLASHQFQMLVCMDANHDHDRDPANFFMYGKRHLRPVRLTYVSQ
jgi:hypothetical protein